MFVLSQYYQKVRRLQPVKHFLSGVNPAFVGMIIAAAVILAPAILPGEQPIRIGINIGLLAITLVLIGKLKWHPALSLGIGSATGILMGFVPGFS